MPMIIIDEGPGSAASPPYNNDGSAYQQQRIVDLSHFTTPQGWAKLAQIVRAQYLVFGDPRSLTVFAKHCLMFDISLRSSGL